jgi:hypothetical protein
LRASRALADIGDAVFDRTRAGCDERVVGDVDIVECDLLRGSVERLRGRSGLVRVGIGAVDGPAQRLLPLMTVC